MSQSQYFPEKDQKEQTRIERKRHDERLKAGEHAITNIINNYNEEDIQTMQDMHQYDNVISEIDKLIENLDDSRLQKKWDAAKARSYEEMKHRDVSWDFWVDKNRYLAKNRIEANIGPFQLPRQLGGGGLLEGINTNLVISKKMPFKIPLLPPITIKFAQKKRLRSRVKRKSTRKRKNVSRKRKNTKRRTYS
tara:strand:+ start:2703 stop:3278 length:576 start_codon:yes stop_codon:yes gene_type:complete